MKCKKHGMKPKKGAPKKSNHSMMEMMEKSMHGSNRGAGFKGYGLKKGGM
jgi:hypothetical protein